MSKSTITVHCIRGCDNGLAGIAIEVDGYFEKQMTDPLFANPKLSKHVNYIKQSRFVNHVYNIYDTEGNIINQARAAKNGKYYPKKILVWLAERKLTPAQCQGYIESNFWNLVKKVAGIKEYEKPKFADTVEHATFNELFSYEDIIDMVSRKYCTGKDRGYNSTSAFFQADKAHIYSFFPKGAVPQEFINDMELQANHLHKSDAKKVSNVPKVIELNDEDDILGFTPTKKAPPAVPAVAMAPEKKRKKSDDSTIETSDSSTKKQKKTPRTRQKVSTTVHTLVAAADGLGDGNTVVTNNGTGNRKDDVDYDSST